MTTKAELERQLELSQYEASNAIRSRLNALEELSKVSAELQQAKNDLERVKRAHEEDLQIIRAIRFACSHRIKVSHDCDVSQEWTITDSGESKPVPACEEVRFLREIVRLCKCNELPF